MNETTFIAIISAAMLIFLQVFHLYERRETRRHYVQETERLHEHYQGEYEQWAEERQKLLDRIQAESYREYKTQEIRMTKAQNNTDHERPILELL